ncbi:hypothetical protein RHSIM_Rhsim03G0128800 [Rhododendron simsii]|uniref:Uncharacterized protein n=1 Tax=Rhododendron simsii TaxID=118357 RepID=A0A834H8L8_RHOSS|nr:hypothetical protein RHSIM_Rhsim03G0128800 [Rhododendron simsii]
MLLCNREPTLDVVYEDLPNPFGNSAEPKAVASLCSLHPLVWATHVCPSPDLLPVQAVADWNLYPNGSTRNLLVGLLRDLRLPLANPTSCRPATLDQVWTQVGNGKQKDACEQSVQGQVFTLARLYPSSTSTGTSVIQEPTDELNDSKDELLEVLESVVSSKQESETLANHLKPAASLDVDPCDSRTPLGMISPQPLEVKGVFVHYGLKLPESHDILGSGVKGRATEKVPIGGLVTNKSLSKFAQKD